MSYIFEALQRAETERSGGKPPENVESVADLLQAVEQELALKQAEAERSGSLLKNAAATVGPAPDVEAKVAAQPSASSLLAGKAEASEAKSAEAKSAPEGKSAAPGASEPNTFAQAKVLSPALAFDSRLVCLTEQGGLAAEKFRMLGLKLRHLREQRKLKRIVVTGTAPEEGKSLVAANLALNQSRSKVLKTLLVDGDLRRPTVAGRFGFDSSLPGTERVFAGRAAAF